MEGQRWAEVVKVPPAQQVEYDRRGSKTASRPPRTSAASTKMRPAPGMVGTGMSRWSCSPLPCCLQSAIRPIRRKSQRPCLKNNKPRRHQNPLPLIRWSIQKIRRIAQRIAQRQNKPSPHYRMVTLARSPSSRRQTRTSKNYNHNCNASKPKTTFLATGPDQGDKSITAEARYQHSD